jgi:hypothetical protein
MAQASLASAGGDQFTVGKPGQIADLENSQIITKQNSTATVIDFGVAAFWDTADADGSCRVQTGASDFCLGITVAEPLMVASSDGLDTVNYARYANVPILIDGTIYVQFAEATLAQDEVVAILGGGAGNTSPGALGGVHGGAVSTTRLLVPGAVILDTVASGGIGRVRIKTVGNVRTTT